MQTRKKWRLLIKSGKPRQTTTTTTAAAARHHPFPFSYLSCGSPSLEMFIRRLAGTVHTRRTNPIKMRISFRARARAQRTASCSNSTRTTISKQKNDPVQEGSRKERETFFSLFSSDRLKNFSKASLNLPSESVIRENIILVIGRSRGEEGKQREKIRHAAWRGEEGNATRMQKIIDRISENREKRKETKRPLPQRSWAPSDLRIELPRCIPRWF